MHVELATISTISPIRGCPRLVVRPRSEYRMSEQGPRFPANTHSHTHTHTHMRTHTISLPLITFLFWVIYSFISLTREMFFLFLHIYDSEKTQSTVLHKFIKKHSDTHQYADLYTKFLMSSIQMCTQYSKLVHAQARMESCMKSHHCHDVLKKKYFQWECLTVSARPEELMHSSNQLDF